jgi:hypothetical protein
MPIRGLGNQQDLLNRLGTPKSGLDEIPAQSNPQQLKNLLDANIGMIKRGSNMVAKSEAAWLTALAAHPDADASVRQAFLDKVADIPLSRSAKEAGFGELLETLKNGGNVSAPTDTGGATRPDVPGASDGVDAGGGTVTDTTNIPTGGTGNDGGGNIIDVIAGGGGRIDNTGGAGGAGAVKKTDPLNFKGELTFEGPWKISDAALQRSYNGVKMEDFGTTDVQLPMGGTNKVNDMVYDLGDGKVGMHLIPISDGGAVTDVDGTQKKGHELMDAHLRKEMGLGPDDPIFSLIAYVHPEEHSGDLKALGTQMVKTEMGATHIGAYVGEGKTTNSPETYHSREWQVKGYPANVQVVSMDGTDQATLNKNALMVDAALNLNVQFPPDYKNDKFRTIDINTTMMFYRDWLAGADHLKNDPTWHTYCAEHKTIVTNVMLNLPHNLESFKEVFGDDADKVWGDFKAKFKETQGREFTAADETHFEPLYKKEGLTGKDISPFKDLAEYQAYDNARHSGDLATFTGRRPLEPGKGMAWAPETTADLLNDFLQTYTGVEDVGGPIAASALMGFKDTAKDRMGIDDMTFLGHAVPVINKMMIADAMMRADDPGYAKKAAGELYAAFGGDVQQLMAGNPDPQLMGLVEQCMQGVKGQLGDIITDQNRPDDAAARAAMADAWLDQALAPELDRARKQAVSDPSKTQFYSPPAVTHRVSIGMHESSKFVNIKTVATAVDASEVEAQ